MDGILHILCARFIDELLIGYRFYDLAIAGFSGRNFRGIFKLKHELMNILNEF